MNWDASSGFKFSSVINIVGHESVAANDSVGQNID